MFGNGSDFGLEDLNYTYQRGEGGIADALKLCEHFVDGEKFVVVLGDNIIGGNIKSAVEDFERQEKGGKILLKEVPDPERFGVATIEDGKVTKIIEKPDEPESNLAVIGIYMYDATAFDIARDLKPSDRGELEITDVNNHFIDANTMTYEVLDGWWTDAGTFKSLLRASNMVAEGGANHIEPAS